MRTSTAASQRLNPVIDFICDYCNPPKDCKNAQGLGSHVASTHSGKQKEFKERRELTKQLRAADTPSSAPEPTLERIEPPAAPPKPPTTEHVQQTASNGVPKTPLEHLEVAITTSEAELEVTRTEIQRLQALQEQEGTLVQRIEGLKLTRTNWDKKPAAASSAASGAGA